MFENLANHLGKAEHCHGNIIDVFHNYFLEGKRLGSVSYL